MEGKYKMTYSEFIFWFDGFTTGKNKIGVDEMTKVKLMLDTLFERQVVKLDLPCPPFNPAYNEQRHDG
jgi:hypothetical protein